jgi:hypothetical protein
MTVDQQDRRSAPAVPDTKPNPAEVNIVELKAVKHALRLPPQR